MFLGTSLNLRIRSTITFQRNEDLFRRRTLLIAVNYPVEQKNKPVRNFSTQVDTFLKQALSVVCISSFLALEFVFLLVTRIMGNRLNLLRVSSSNLYLPPYRLNPRCVPKWDTLPDSFSQPVAVEIVQDTHSCLMTVSYCFPCISPLFTFSEVVPRTESFASPKTFAS